MTEFLRDFFYDGFDPGEFAYGTTHLLGVLTVIVSVIWFSYALRNYPKEVIFRKMRIIAIIGLSIYIIRRSLGLIGAANILELYWPFYLCNINTILLSVWIIFGFRKGLDFFIVTGLLGGLFTFAIPDGIFTDRYLTFGIVDSLMSHYTIVVIPLVLLITKAHTLKLKNIYQVAIGLLLTLINTELIQPLFFHKHFDYLFLRGTIPFTISGVPQYLIIFVLAIILVLGIYGLDILYCRYSKKVSEK
jgi:uncharacterized membrane protein YwaF